MKLLLIKTSSMGDVIHALPALTDAMQHFPNLRVDWVVEEGFIDIPTWHPAVNKVIPIAMRRWRKSLWQNLKNGEIKQFVKALRQQKYDVIIDAQGLIKSALITRLAKGKRFGFGKGSTKEPVAWAYHCPQIISRNQHAVTRLRELFAKCLNYPMPDSKPDYGITPFFSRSELKQDVMFVHGTTWPSKHWPEAYWIELANTLTQAGYKLKLPHSNQVEKDRAELIAKVSSQIEVLPKMTLTELGHEIAKMKAIVAVDTGLSHLAAALNIPTVTLYGPTDPNKIGTMGQNQIHLASHFACCRKKVCTYVNSTQIMNPPCYTEITPAKVWANLQTII
ncbi:MAG: ADP-heptose--LPS heptosyltransferase [Gammaproteobacteria bacterium]|jgi:heptosyltransferase-1|nr:ADP-heptose--LPS heptosyltransferase [Gammaproteobacteria bacterium]